MKTTIIIGTILTFAVILIAIITGLMGTISTSGGKGGKTNAQCVTYQKMAMKKTMMALSPQSTSTKTDPASASDSDPLRRGQKPMKMPTKSLWLLVNAGLSGESAA